MPAPRPGGSPPSAPRRRAAAPLPERNSLHPGGQPMPDARPNAVSLRGNPVTLVGPEIKPGQSAPEFTAVDNSLAPVKLSDAKGKVLILSAVPSLDTPVCDTETRRFNVEAGKLPGGVEVWTISMDLPFAQKRWCGAAGATAVKTLSDFRERAFAPAYG